MKFVHDINDKGQHRIISPDGIVGEWFSYQNIATLQRRGITYFAVTQYFAGGTLIPETVYRAEVQG